MAEGEKTNGNGSDEPKEGSENLDEIIEIQKESKTKPNVPKDSGDGKDENGMSKEDRKAAKKHAKEAYGKEYPIRSIVKTGAKILGGIAVGGAVIYGIHKLATMNNPDVDFAYNTADSHITYQFWLHDRAGEAGDEGKVPRDFFKKVKILFDKPHKGVKGYIAVDTDGNGGVDEYHRIGANGKIIGDALTANDGLDAARGHFDNAYEAWRNGNKNIESYATEQYKMSITKVNSVEAKHIPTRTIGGEAEEIEDPSPNYSKSYNPVKGDATNHAPEMEDIETIEHKLGDSKDYTGYVKASDKDKDAKLKYEFVGAHDGLTINPATGVIKIDGSSITSETTLNYKVKVTDQHGASAEKTLKVNYKKNQ